MSAFSPVTAALPAIAETVAEGLQRYPKSLSPWLLYDAEGSRLFEEITALPEYYLTGVEREILEQHAGDVLREAGSSLALLELGAGTAAKTATLIRALLGRQLQVNYYPIDVSGSALQVACRSLGAISPRIKVHPIIADYTRGVDAIASVGGRRLALYLGSSIGNFEPEEAVTVLRRLRSHLRAGDALVLGADLVKSAPLLRRAYNDAAGVTARFNKNMLARINRELGGHFELRQFRHRALWNRQRSRIEMYLVSARVQSVAIDVLDMEVAFAAGERIHTENSYKYTPDRLDSMLRQGGFDPERRWTDRHGWFALSLARAA